MVNSFNKTVFRTIKNHFARFLAMTAIVALGIAFITGLSATAPNMCDSVNKYFNSHLVPDIIVKAPNGFTSEQQDYLKQNSFTQEVTCIDMLINEQTIRFYYVPLKNQLLNKLDLLEGSMPKSANEILIERKSKTEQLKLGSETVINFETLTVCGIVGDAMMFSIAKEPSMLENNLDLVIYFDSAYSAPPIVTDMYIKLNNADNDLFSKNYENYINNKISNFKNISTEANPLIFLTLNENFSFALYKSNTEKLEVIALIFPVFFIAVAALVLLTTMTRLVEDERSTIGCYKTLGYSDKKITLKYILYSLLCSFFGVIIGLAFGFRILPEFIYSAYAGLFYLPTLTYGFFFTFGIVTSVIMISALVLVTWRVVSNMLKQTPSNLLKPKAPKAGKKIFLEKVPFIWEKLKFKYKSSFRNVFRYAKNFVLSVVSIAGCTALVLAGLGLFDSINSTIPTANQDTAVFGAMKDSIISIAALLIVVAGLLSIIVMYNLTNMNIEERKKEIATLKVLGYKNFEVSGYIFREIFILTCFGIIVGLPLGYGLLSIVISYMSTDIIPFALFINWYTWFLCIFISLAFIVIVSLLLYKKIIKIDMNESLKTVD